MQLYTRTYGNVDAIKSRLMTRLVEEWQMFDQKIIDWANKQWRPRLWACVCEQGGHCEHQL